MGGAIRLIADSMAIPHEGKLSNGIYFVHQKSDYMIAVKGPKVTSTPNPSDLTRGNNFNS